MNCLPVLTQYITGLLEEADLIPEARKTQLSKLADYISNKSEPNHAIALNFICTHNSRRSHISQIWAATASAYFNLDYIATFSGGTESTAFNARAVAAMERAGFQIKNPGGDNPHYQVYFAENEPPLTCFSKVFDDPYNPQKGFAAIMTCSQADENCPFIPGAELRLPLTYEDPKVADNTPEERAVYDDRVRQIGREIFYAFTLINRKVNE
ncbi:MAG: arsenate reductase [Saprospiraceae bacterium]|nr:MAG: arsenate reductase [Saprospiraceae bacterium]